MKKQHISENVAIYQDRVKKTYTSIILEKVYWLETSLYFMRDVKTVILCKCWSPSACSRPVKSFQNRPLIEQTKAVFFSAAEDLVLCNASQYDVDIIKI